MRPIERSRQLALDAGEELHEEGLERDRRRGPREDEPEGVRPCRRERPCRTVRVPAELAGDGDDPLARRVRDARPPVQRVRDRALGHARPRGDVHDRHPARSVVVSPTPAAPTRPLSTEPAQQVYSFLPIYTHRLHAPCQYALLDRLSSHDDPHRQRLEVPGRRSSGERPRPRTRSRARPRPTGAGSSIWDRFCEKPGNVRNGESGALACDFYHRYRDDIALARDLGVNAFRLSISWPRVLPEGRGSVNEAGLDFYDRVVDELLANEHRARRDALPLGPAGGARGCGRLAGARHGRGLRRVREVVGARLGDRVRHWITLNEPWVIAWLGYGYGVHAPGRTSAADAIAAAHHVLLSHGLATEVLRRESPGVPRRRLDRPRGRAVRERRPRGRRRPRAPSTGTGTAGSSTRSSAAPIPADVLERLAPNEPPVQDGDLARISAPIDFLGVNYYQRRVVAGAQRLGLAVRAPGRLDAHRHRLGGVARTASTS